MPRCEIEATAGLGIEPRATPLLSSEVVGSLDKPKLPRHCARTDRRQTVVSISDEVGAVYLVKLPLSERAASHRDE